MKFCAVKPRRIDHGGNVVESFIILAHVNHKYDWRHIGTMMNCSNAEEIICTCR